MLWIQSPTLFISGLPFTAKRLLTSIGVPIFAQTGNSGWLGYILEGIPLVRKMPTYRIRAEAYFIFRDLIINFFIWICMDRFLYNRQ